MFTLKEAAKRLTKSEYALYLATEARYLEKMTRRQIDLKVKRILKEILKLKDNKQKIERVFKSAGIEAEKLMKSKTKLKYFNEALKRLKKQIQAISSPSKPTNKKIRAKKVISKKKSILASTPKTKKTTLRNTGTIRKQAHSSSRNRRAQGKKDSR